MAYYDLLKPQREELANTIKADLVDDLVAGRLRSALIYAADEDTYIRKTVYLAFGRIYLNSPRLQDRILEHIDDLSGNSDFKVRQTAINAAGEIGKKEFSRVQHIFDTGLSDNHNSPRNAVIGSVKKMGKVNPGPVLTWAKNYLHHPDEEIRREICHGIELRGRKHPEDILPLLEELQFDTTRRVRDTLVHVLGQIAYKKGCLEIVITQLKTWKNQLLVADAVLEIIDVHDRYRNFSALTTDEARRYIFLHLHS